MNTATLIHEAIQKHLDLKPDGRTSHNVSEVARKLGVSRQGWAQYLEGARQPREATLDGWLATCREMGIDVPQDVYSALKAAM